jgi:hypothetical protein
MRNDFEAKMWGERCTARFFHAMKIVADRLICYRTKKDSQMNETQKLHEVFQNTAEILSWCCPFSRAFTP